MRPRRRSARLVAALILAVAVARSSPVQGQDPAPRRASCLDSIPVAAMRRVPVYAAADVAEEQSVGTATAASMDLLTQAVAEQTRMLLGASPGQLPPGEPAITWRELDHRLLVIAYRDGRLTWRVQPPGWISDQSVGPSGARQLERAMELARRNGALFVWDDALRRDSLAWVIRLEPAVLNEGGAITPPSLRAGFPVFSVLAPPILPADVERIRTNFPMVRIRGFSGTVRLQFVIDTMGRVVPATIRGVLPRNDARLVGPQGFAYDSLVRVMRIALEDARFVPARIGPCTVNQLVQQAFTYRPAR
jgi:hypothetical protein